MAAVLEDEESLLASGREFEDFSHGLRKTARWQARYRSLFQYRGNWMRVASFVTLAVLAIVMIALWIMYEYRSRSP